MTRDEVAALCIQITSDVLKVPHEKIHELSGIETDLAGDSLDLLKVAAQVEQSTGIQLDTAELRQVRVVGDFVVMVHRKMREQGAV